MKKLSFFIVLIAWLTSAAAQEQELPAKINWGPEMAEPNSTYISKVIGNTADGFYALRRKNPSAIAARPRVWVEQYGNDMKLRRSEELDLRFKKKVRDFENVIMLGDKLWFLTSFNNLGKKKNYLFAQQLNTRLQASNNLILMGEIDSKNKVKEGRFDTHISRDSSKLLVYNQLPYNRNEPEQFAFRVFDTNLNELWKKNIRLPYPDDVFDVKDYRVDNEGNVYILGVVYETKKARTVSNRSANYRYSVLAYTDEGERKKEYKISLRDKFITDLTFRVGNDGNLVLAGFYSEQSVENAKGTCYFRINAETEEMMRIAVKEFDFEFLTEQMNERQRDRAELAEERGDTRREAELLQYDLDDLILRSDGGAVLIAEQYYVFEDTYQDFVDPRFGGVGRVGRFGNAGFQRDRYYNYNDIIVVNISPDGNIDWASRIPKRQRTVNDGGYYSSYAKTITSGKLYFVYNDNPRNLEADERRRNRIYDFNGAGSVIIMAEVDMQGNVNLFPIDSSRNASVLTRPKICRQIGKRTMAIYGENGRRYRFGSLDFL